MLLILFHRNEKTVKMYRMYGNQENGIFDVCFTKVYMSGLGEDSS